MTQLQVTSYRFISFATDRVFFQLILFFVFIGVIYYGSRAIPGTTDVVHKLKKLVHILLIGADSFLFLLFVFVLTSTTYCSNSVV